TNPFPWSELTNMAGWVPRAPVAPHDPDATADVNTWGARLGLQSDFTRESCEAVGGIFVNSYSCAYNYIPFYNLVEDNDIYRLYGQATWAINDTTEYFLRVANSRVHTPHAYGSPSQPVIRGPAENTGATYQL